MAIIKKIVFNHFEENTYVVCDETQQCVVIDPGMATPEENDTMTDILSNYNLKVAAILLTHTHIDHIAGLKSLFDYCQAPVFLHTDGLELLRQSEIYASVMGFKIDKLDGIPLTTLSQGETVSFGHSKIEARWVPGHAAGSLVFCLHSDKAVFTGDALFNMSIGRTDLPTGDFQQLLSKLREQVLPLPDDYEVFPGHGPKTTIGFEKKHNPFINPR
ncbi:MAG: MBL fold metallo-hydrolase [Bacteroidales bacterium]|nr:MBL fold metallo-hydrolase [Bacteroidales bacterium]MBR5027975.1 MBL fold metallo-hydrolase [Bacteroidales bacterium]